MTKENEGKKYVQFYSTTLGKKIVDQETSYVGEKIRGCKKVLSIGCGPALVDAKIHQLYPGINIIGLDNAIEMIQQAPTNISLVRGDAQHLGCKDHSFDAVFYLTSLEFIENIQKAIKETYRVLACKGILLVLMLNPHSYYFQEKYNTHNSYIQKKIKHTNISTIQKGISQYFSIKNVDYFLGINRQEIVNTHDQSTASLYVLEAEKL